MKTLTVYALLLGTGVMTLLSVFDRSDSHVALLSPLELSSPFELDSSVELPAILANDSDSTSDHRKKEYHIYFENRSEESIDVAIHFKDYNGDWNTQGFISLDAGEKREMGVSDERTYFYYAETKQKWKKKQWKGQYYFPVLENILNKVSFNKDQIWECYDTHMCNTYAVFR